MKVFQKSIFYIFSLIIVGCNSPIEDQTSVINADYMALHNNKDLLKTAIPNEKNHFDYKKLVNSYVYNISTLTHELDSLNKLLQIDSLPIHRRNQFYIDYIIYRINVGDPDSAEKLIREVFVKKPTDSWTSDYINYELNLNMSFSKLSRSDCDSATRYYHVLINSIESDATQFKAERLESAKVLLNAINNRCPNSID